MNYITNLMAAKQVNIRIINDSVILFPSDESETSP
jgi:hypothetical protein